ncbi:MAG: hypothetical protein OCD76_06730 [Reichenbachiella sp.]
MTKLFYISFLILITNYAFGQANWKISAIGVGPIQLGNSISETRAKVGKPFSTRDNEKDGFDVYRGTDKLISIWSKRADRNIGFIKITSELFETTDGLRTGLTITEVEQIRDDFFFELDEMTGQEYFMPTELQTPSEEFYSNLNLLYFKSNSGEKLVDNFELDEQSQSLRSTKYRKNGYLEYFYIYQWR